MKYFLAFICVLFPVAALAQGQGGQPAPQIQYVTVAPSGACGRNNLRLLTPNGVIYTCVNGIWTVATTPGGGGGGSPAGSATQLQYNAGGTPNVFGANAGLVFGGDPNNIVLGGATLPFAGGIASGGISVNPVLDASVANTGYALLGQVDLNQAMDDGNVFLVGLEGQVVTRLANNHDLGSLYGVEGAVIKNGTGSATQLYGFSSLVYVNNGSTVDDVWGLQIYPEFHFAAITNWFGVETSAPHLMDGATLTNAWAFYVDDLGVAPKATNPYYSWFDSRGVGRCKEDSTFDSVGQSICVVYNPQFTKYTAGAVNYERIVYGEFSANRALMGTEAGGTGTKRPVDLISANFSVKSTLTPAVTNTSAASCGTTAATIAGNDNAFKIVVGATAGTSCTVTFATAFTNAPSCMVTNETTANLARATSSSSAVILAGTFVAGDTLAGVCIGR